MTAALTLRVDPFEPEWPALTILVDGRDLTTLVDDELIGLDPADALDGRLLPADPPREVTVYRCTCGEIGCGSLRAEIEREDPYVVWRGGGLTLRFDAAQYETEVLRATADRSWETPRRAASRVLGFLLRADARLATLGYDVHWVAPHHAVPDAFQVSLWDRGRRQIVVDLRTPPRETEAWAADLAEALLGTNPDLWDVTFRGSTSAGSAP